MYLAISIFKWKIPSLTNSRYSISIKRKSMGTQYGDQMSGNFKLLDRAITKMSGKIPRRFLKHLSGTSLDSTQSNVYLSFLDNAILVISNHLKSSVSLRTFVFKKAIHYLICFLNISIVNDYKISKSVQYCHVNNKRYPFQPLLLNRSLIYIVSLNPFNKVDILFPDFKK